MYKKRILSGVIAGLLLSTGGAFAAKCKISDLTKCLDSVCYDGIDQGSRCWQCGTSAAKKPAAIEYALGDSPVMQSLSVGVSSKTSISAKELKSAPDDPGERYKWATKQCLAKLTDCTTDEADDNYDPLIQQACKAVMGEQEYAAALKKVQTKKTEEQCLAEIQNCVLRDDKCGSDLLNCSADSAFDQNVAYCAADANGCSDFISKIRANLQTSKDDMLAKRKTRISDFQKRKADERLAKMNAANAMCGNGGKNGCIIEICGNMPNGLGDEGFCADQEEERVAGILCKFVDTACDRMK